MINTINIKNNITISGTFYSSYTPFALRNYQGVKTYGSYYSECSRRLVLDTKLKSENEYGYGKRHTGIYTSEYLPGIQDSVFGKSNFSELGDNLYSIKRLQTDKRKFISKKDILVMKCIFNGAYDSWYVYDKTKDIFIVDGNNGMLFCYGEIVPSGITIPKLFNKFIKKRMIKQKLKR